MKRDCILHCIFQGRGRRGGIYILHCIFQGREEGGGDIILRLLTQSLLLIEEGYVINVFTPLKVHSIPFLYWYIPNPIIIS